MSTAARTAPEPFEVRIAPDVVTELRERLARARWPPQPPGGWELGAEVEYARELCEHWRDEYDFTRLQRLNELGSAHWDGIHFLRVSPPGGDDRAARTRTDPVVLLHGWPSGPIEYERAAALVAASGREAIVPSLPGYAWSHDPGVALNVAAMAARLRALLRGGLGLERCALAGGDWGAMLAARIAFDDPGLVGALHVSTPHTLPAPGDLGEPPLSEAESAWIERAQRWRRRRGHHMVIQGLAPDAISPALTDSPAGLAAYLLGKYRDWSDCGGELERRFSRDELCDFLTIYWATGSVASSMRLYWAERRDRWRLGPGEAIEVPAGIAAFPGDMAGGGGDAEAGLNPPRAWSERLLSDLRRWTTMPAGGHFAAFEEPEAYAAELGAFLEQAEG